MIRLEQPRAFEKSTFRNMHRHHRTVAVKTVRVKGYWNYWKYRIILYVSERILHRLVRSNQRRRLLSILCQESNALSQTGTNYVIGKKLCVSRMQKN